LAIGALVLPAPYALAGWVGFYTSSQRKPAPVKVTQWPVQNICIREILLAQARYEIPDNILLGIGLQEAGTRINKQLVVWPWAINAEGRGSFFDTKARAINWVQEQLNGGMRSIDVGCMQVNLRWHPDAFSDLSDAFDPEQNVDYAARLLLSHYNATGNWRSASGRYHSKTPEKQKIYLTNLERNIRVANAQIDMFRTIAGLGPTGIVVAEKSIQKAVPKLQGGSFWTAALTSQGSPEARFRSLYSRVDLQPILPNFTQNTLRGTE
jgi:hypothetical protein